MIAALPSRGTPTIALSSSPVETENDRIFVAQMGEIDVDAVGRKINGLIEKAYEEDKDIREEIKGIVPEYKMKGEQQ